MSTVIRPELSKSNKNYISKHRYYELKHFCLQYKEYEKIYNDLCNYIPSEHKITSEHMHIDSKINEIRMRYLDKINLIEECAKLTDCELWAYILKGVTEERSYGNLKSVSNIPCCKDTYYQLYRKFFYILDRRKDA